MSPLLSMRAMAVVGVVAVGVPAPLLLLIVILSRSAVPPAPPGLVRLKKGTVSRETVRLERVNKRAV
jgi:hypothetical protein